jgi:hypothetical protein
MLKELIYDPKVPICELKRNENISTPKLAHECSLTPLFITKRWKHPQMSIN